ncbi:MAG: lichenicidin A2 family type 2 lantibiotic [Lachnospiraceae bacterium]|nr:lichenicidin A2 family type 2 lantibiotic [Lachnospiraceae bacterium]
MEKVVGAAFEEMDVADMENIQGAGDVEAEFTPTPAIVASSAGCAGAASAIASAVSGAVVSAKKC